MHLLIRCLVACLAVMAAAVPAGARGRPTPAPTASAGDSTASAGDSTARPPSLASLRARAARSAASYAAARAEQARLEDQVTALERQVSELDARIRPLRAQVTRQAVAVYQGDVAVAAVTQFEAVAAMMRSDRAAHLVADLTARHRPTLAPLLQAQRDLRQRRDELDARRQQQEVAMADLKAQREQISLELQSLAAAMPPGPDRRRPLPRASRSASSLRQRLGRATPGAAGFVCPIDGPLTFSDDFGTPRPGGRRHLGNDLLSPRGTPNVAVVDGTIETRAWSGGGITVFLYGDDGHTYIYMHLLRIEGAVPRRVVQGEVIALTGSTGHSYGYHTHFEYHPKGGAAVSPYPLLAAACL